MTQVGADRRRNLWACAPHPPVFFLLSATPFHGAPASSYGHERLPLPSAGLQFVVILSAWDAHPVRHGCWAGDTSPYLPAWRSPCKPPCAWALLCRPGMTRGWSRGMRTSATSTACWASQVRSLLGSPLLLGMGSLRCRAWEASRDTVRTSAGVAAPRCLQSTLGFRTPLERCSPAAVPTGPRRAAPPRPDAVLCFGGSIAIAGLLYHFFAPGGHDCSFNIAVITVALGLCVVFSLVSLHPAVRSGAMVEQRARCRGREGALTLPWGSMLPASALGFLGRRVLLLVSARQVAGVVLGRRLQRVALAAVQSRQGEDGGQRREAQPGSPACSPASLALQTAPPRPCLVTRLAPPPPPRRWRRAASSPPPASPCTSCTSATPPWPPSRATMSATAWASG